MSRFGLTLDGKRLQIVVAKKKRFDRYAIFTWNIISPCISAKLRYLRPDRSGSSSLLHDGTRAAEVLGHHRERCAT